MDSRCSDEDARVFKQAQVKRKRGREERKRGREEEKRTREEDSGEKERGYALKIAFALFGHVVWSRGGDIFGPIRGGKSKNQKPRSGR
jgi:hypothetical protein